MQKKYVYLRKNINNIKNLSEKLKRTKFKMFGIIPSYLISKRFKKKYHKYLIFKKVNYEKKTK